MYWQPPMGNSWHCCHRHVFLCNHGCRSAAKAYARQLGHRVYCFPEDAVPYDTTPEKERLVSSILPKKGGDGIFYFDRNETKAHITIGILGCHPGLA